MPVRLYVVYGADAKYKFYGHVASIEPSMGQYWDRTVSVTVVDYMDYLATHNLNMITPQTNITGGSMVATVLANMGTQPLQTNYNTGDTFVHGLHTERDESTTALTALQKIAQSGLDMIYVKGDASGGEYFQYKSRHVLMNEITGNSISATFDNSMVGLRVVRSSSDIYTRFKVTTYPASRDAEPVILYTIPEAIPLSPGQVYTFKARYVDPLNSGARVSGEDMITPVIGRDYHMAPNIDNIPQYSWQRQGVSKLDASLGVSVTFGANSADVTLTNNAAVIGYVTRFNLRGYGLYEYMTQEANGTAGTANLALYGDIQLNLDLPYQSNFHVAEDFVAHFKTKYTNIYSNIESLEFIANSGTALMSAMLGVDVGDLVQFNETVSGITTSNTYLVHGYGLSIEQGNVIKCTLGPLSLVEDQAFFKVGNEITDENVIAY